MLQIVGWEINYHNFWIFCDPENENLAVRSASLLPLFYPILSQCIPYLQFSNCQSNSVVIQILDTLMLRATQFFCSVYNFSCCLMTCFWISSSVHFLKLSKNFIFAACWAKCRKVWCIFSHIKVLYFTCIVYWHNSISSVGTIILEELGAFIYRISSTLSMEKVGFSEMLLSVDQTVLYYIAED